MKYNVIYHVLLRELTIAILLGETAIVENDKHIL